MNKFPSEEDENFLKVRRRIEEALRFIPDERFTTVLTRTGTASTIHALLEPSSPSAESDPELTFNLYEIFPSVEPSLLCHNAFFHPNWLDSMVRSTGSRLFQCRCRRNDSFQKAVNTFTRQTHEEQLQFSCTAFFI
jgi:hypothetical protein